MANVTKINGESGKNGIFAMRLANIPIILESGNLDENGENLLSRVNLAKKSPKVWKEFKWNYISGIASCIYLEIWASSSLMQNISVLK